MSLDFTLDRFYAADPARVWAHFTEPDLMAAWFSPNPSLETRCTLDVRPGGAWRCDMGGYVVSGTYVAVEAPSTLSFTWSWEHDDDPATTVTVTISPEDGGTRLVLAHAETEPDVGDDGHRGGWERSLTRLDEALH